MSLVFTLVHKDFVLMTGDHRRTFLKDKTIYFDDMSKIIQVNRKVLVGFTGDAEAIEIIKSNIRVNPNETVQSVARKIGQMLKGHHKRLILDIQVSGIGDSGKYECVWLSHKHDFRKKHTKVFGNEVKCVDSGSQVGVKEIFDENFEKLKDFNVDIAERLLKTVNEEVSKIDKTVSKTCDILILD